MFRRLFGRWRRYRPRVARFRCYGFASLDPAPELECRTLPALRSGCPAPDLPAPRRQLQPATQASDKLLPHRISLLRVGFFKQRFGSEQSWARALRGTAGGVALFPIEFQKRCNNRRNALAHWRAGSAYRSAGGTRCQLRRQYFQSASVVFSMVLEDLCSQRPLRLARSRFRAEIALLDPRWILAVSHPM